MDGRDPKQSHFFKIFIAIVSLMVGINRDTCGLKRLLNAFVLSKASLCWYCGNMTKAGESCQSRKPSLENERSRKRDQKHPSGCLYKVEIRISGLFSLQHARGRTMLFVLIAESYS